MINLQFIETKYGKILINPIGDNIFILNDGALKEIVNQAFINLIVYGENYVEVF